ncbi:hypothetical protein A1O3_08535 [Capronia epimyces CBS 606.96]|uniref:Xylanolytic transcriptional activator regulatory domain-containing protein n=1 Tax=Capronia epimyces CBS 606.96 TaxID=1182542 RepID=W9Y9G9_9EURO|nr:uncharacterized protein A1O3_08535 [Capronia epimyces CBS 606.96]EXJ79034.1 hypothetical protein A1O3_08535 [Capronia epimyces CBS 606.96]
MASRICSLEKSLAKATEHRDSVSVPSPAPSTGSAEPLLTETASPPQPAREIRPRPNNPSYRSREDVLVQKGSSSQYFNEILLSRVLEEESSIESVLTTAPAGSPCPPVSPFSALGILSSPFPSQTLSGFHPPKSVAVRLWNSYVNNVEGCAVLKLLHLPTHEVEVYSTIDRPAAASFESHALCFAIYFASAASLDEPDAHAILGQDMSARLLGFKVGLEQAFAQGDFLDRPTLTGLHALAIYLSALRVRNRGKGIWVLNGLAIRIAESLGLHRDGERLGLSPFQSELRRRLWWQLLSRDGRAGEDYGLEDTKGLLLTSDVKLPLNIDDGDLRPEMKELPAAKQGWTSMTFSLINIDLVRTMQTLTAIASSSTPSSPPSEDERAQITKETRTRIEERLVHCNPVIPQQRLTLYCSLFLIRKLDFVTRQQWLLLRHPGGSREHFATEENLIEALEVLEPRLDNEDELLMQFAWAKKAYPQYHVTMYVLWHLCVKPEGPSVDRAWQAVEVLFSGELWDEITSGFGSKSAVLAALRAKAVSLREKIQARNLGWEASNGNGNGNGDMGLHTGKGPSGVATSPASLFGDPGSDKLGFDIDIDSDVWPDWTTLAQGFQPDGQGFFDDSWR